MPHGSPSYTLNGAELVRRRENAGWSQRELAAKCKAAGRAVDASQIARYETGQSTPRPAALTVMAEVLKCEPDDLAIRTAVVA
ncbi:helix-turn-helix domain-containing protein [Amycolatopsis tolypomycina]|uniref:helix-turn-helix domain-containing protein n=1 Tax=Amycolatopsis tolypomycina TaxID=208445 RepID=UPI0033AC24FC